MKLKKNRGCYNIDVSSKYILGAGMGVTLFSRDSFEVIHHFTGIPCISAAHFLTEDLIFVTTGDCRVKLLSIPEKRIVWAPKRFSELGPYGMHNTLVDPDSLSAYFVAVNERRLNHGYLFVVKPLEETYYASEIPGYFCTCRGIAQDLNGSICVLCTQADREYGVANRSHLFRATPPFQPPFETIIDVPIQLQGIEDPERRYIVYYDTPYVFYSYQKDGRQELYWQDLLTQEITQLNLPPEDENDLGLKIQGFTQNQKFLIVYTSKALTVLDFAANEPVARYTGQYVDCGEIIDDSFILGTWNGMWRYPFPYWIKNE